MATMIRVLELYSGIGGMHCALKACPLAYKVVAAYDVNTNANKIYQHNFPDTSVVDKGIEGMTTKVYEEMKIDMILMSPPCQPFTRVGNRQDVKDARTNSFLHVMDLLARVSNPPTYLLVENVKGFEVSQARDKLISTLEQCQYNYQEFLLTPLQFGIPNSRLRYFLIAKKRPLKFTFATGSEIQTTLPACTREWLSYRKQAEEDIVSNTGAQTEGTCCVCGAYTSGLTNVEETHISSEPKGNCGKYDANCGTIIDNKKTKMDETKQDENKDSTCQENTVLNIQGDSDCDLKPAKKRKLSGAGDNDRKEAKKTIEDTDGIVKTGLETEQTGLETSQTGLETPQTGLETSQTGLKSSQTGLETPQTVLETSQTGLNSSQTGLETSSVCEMSKPLLEIDNNENSVTSASNTNRSDEIGDDSNNLNTYMSSRLGDASSANRTLCLENYGINMRQTREKQSDHGPVLRLLQFLQECTDTDRFNKYILTDKDLKRFIVMDIVNTCSRKTTCFTKRYGRFMEGAGSLVQMTKDIQAVINASAFKEVASSQQNSETWKPDQIESIRNLKLRYFTPREIANLLGFPEDFGFPASLTNRQLYMALGNSLNVHVVAVLIQMMTCGDDLIQ